MVAMVVIWHSSLHERSGRDAVRLDYIPGTRFFGVISFNLIASRNLHLSFFQPASITLSKNHDLGRRSRDGENQRTTVVKVLFIVGY